MFKNKLHASALRCSCKCQCFVQNSLIKQHTYRHISVWNCMALPNIHHISNTQSLEAPLWQTDMKKGRGWEASLVGLIDNIDSSVDLKHQQNLSYNTFITIENVALARNYVQCTVHIIWYLQIHTSWKDLTYYDQCCGSMTFWRGSGSGSAGPCLWLMDPDQDAAIFVIGLHDAYKKLIFWHNFFCLLLFNGTFISFFKDKQSKRVTK